MSQISSPSRFIRNIRVLNIIIGIMSIPLAIDGIWQFLEFYSDYSKVTIYPVEFFYAILSTVVSIMSCLIGILNGLIFKKLNYLAIKLSKVLFALNCVFLLLFISDTIIFQLIFHFIERILTGGPLIINLMALLLFFTLTFFLIRLILKLNKNKDILIKHFSKLTCYNCRAPLKHPYKFCTSCGVEQKSRM